MSTQDFVGRCALVTGAARGIGLAVATALYREGASVLMSDLDAETLATAADELRAQYDGCDGRSLKVLPGDLRESDFAAQLPAACDAELGSIDIVVNNAGAAKPSLAIDMPTQAWEQTLQVNLTAPFVISRNAARMMLAEKTEGRIINIASIAATRMSIHAGVAYTASKAGLLGLTRHLAFECAPHGITVNAVCPGGVETDLLAGLASRRGLGTRKKQVPIGRLLEPAEVAGAVMYLTSSGANGITGVALNVDGGSSLGWEAASDYQKLMRDR